MSDSRITNAELDAEIDRNKDSKSTCVACGEVFIGSDHHCDQDRESEIERCRHSHNEMGRQMPRAFSDKIQEAKDLYRN